MSKWTNEQIIEIEKAVMEHLNISPASKELGLPYRAVKFLIETDADRRDRTCRVREAGGLYEAYVDVHGKYKELKQSSDGMQRKIESQNIVIRDQADIILKYDEIPNDFKQIRVQNKKLKSQLDMVTAFLDTLKPSWQLTELRERLQEEDEFYGPHHM